MNNGDETKQFQPQMTPLLQSNSHLISALLCDKICKLSQLLTPVHDGSSQVSHVFPALNDEGNTSDVLATCTCKEQTISAVYLYEVQCTCMKYIQCTSMY